MKTRTAALIGILAAGTATAAVGAIVLPGGIIRGWDRHYTDNAYVRGDVTQIGPRVSGHVIEVSVLDNQPVRRGDVLFRIDDRDYRARLAQANAALAARKAAVGNLDAQIALQRAAIRQAEASLRAASTQSQNAHRDAARASGLAADQLIARSALDASVSAAEVGTARVGEQQANLAAAHERAAVLESQRPQLQADIDAAEAAVALAAIDVESTVVRAPADGRVSERIARVGNYVRAGSQLIALVSSDPWVVANFKETQLDGMRPGARVDVVIDAVPGTTFKGRIDSLAPASGAQFAVLPPDNATGNFTRIVQRIPVRITLLDGQERLVELRPGMSATVRVR